jgi:poly-gamma-glutamate synthesis protein (capsule biosynthesis protein)
MSARRLGFAGDVMLGRLVDREYNDGDRPPKAVWGSMLDRLRELDGLCINLECPLSTRGEEWSRTHRPFRFRADPDWAIPALRRAGVDVASLANNHSLDYEKVALGDTVSALAAAGIAHPGAGEDERSAREPARLSLDGLDVAVLAFTDNTPEYAASDSPGTARIEIDRGNERTRAAIHDALERATAAGEPDLIVASLHWGPNMEVEPPTEFQAFARWLIDEGIDVIHGHSAHVFQGIEVYENAPILYDAGDFVDDYRVDPELHNDRSFLFDLGLSDDGTPEELRLIPTEIRDLAVEEARPDAAAWSRARMRELSEPFGTEFERDGTDLLVSLAE